MRSMRLLCLVLASGLLPALGAMPRAAGTSRAPAGAALSAREVVAAMAGHEANLVRRMRKFHPIVETYVQNTHLDPVLGLVPVMDHYYLGQLNYQGDTRDTSYLKKKPHGLAHDLIVGPFAATAGGLAHFYSMHFHSAGFVAMLFPDARGFDASRYRFQFVRRQFLGSVLCYAFNVQPRRRHSGAFIGRIWIEARHDHLVRFNGAFLGGGYFHFDSWRANVRPGSWLPVFVYSEESDVSGTSLFGLAGHTRFMAETHLWGYGLQPQRLSTSAEIQVAGSVRDASSGRQSPLASERAWQRQAENNVLQRLWRAGMLAPPGPVDKVLETVANNLEITNQLNIAPPVRCRVLLVSPLVSFNIGHTIVLSRGLIDVLPDEASLAMMISRGLAAIAKDIAIDTRFAFYDRMLVPNDHLLQALQLGYTPDQEAIVEQEAIKLIYHSPYRNQLSSAGLFLEALQARAAALPHLMSMSFWGNPLIEGGYATGLAAFQAPRLNFAALNQIEALPLGSRLKVNPWSDAVSMLHTPPITITSAAEKMPFQVTPQHPYLHRLDDAAQLAAQTAIPAPAAAQSAAGSHRP